MNDHFLLEAVWVLWSYGMKYLVSGLTVALLIVLCGSFASKFWVRITLLAGAIFGLWAALFLGVDQGYAAWQRMPNPPAEAFSDTGGPGAALLGGWFPSAILLGGVYLLVRFFLAKRARSTGHEG